MEYVLASLIISMILSLHYFMWKKLCTLLRFSFTLALLIIRYIAEFVNVKSATDVGLLFIWIVLWSFVIDYVYGKIYKKLMEDSYDKK